MGQFWVKTIALSGSVLGDRQQLRKHRAGQLKKLLRYAGFQTTLLSSFVASYQKSILVNWLTSYLNSPTAVFQIW